MSDERPQDEARRCALCGRAATRLTRHHLMPRSRSRKAKRRRRRDERRAVVARQDETTPLCRPCHAMVHATLSEKAIERTYPTVEALRAHPAIGRFVTWVRKQDPARPVRVRWSAARRAGD